MDMLYQRYACPFTLLDELISSGDFNEFVDVFSEQYAERQTWEYYLAKVYDKSFADFKKGLFVKTQPRMTKQELESTIKDSKRILDNFKL